MKEVARAPRNASIPTTLQAQEYSISDIRLVLDMSEIFVEGLSWDKNSKLIFFQRFKLQ